VTLRKLLVANRGEIACRVIRTARTLGLRTVAVYSAADESAPHVSAADEAVFIGPAPAADSYLRIDRVLDAARRTRADALHPGYGFLSERADFAQACVDAGLTFVGPPASAIAAMGDKAGAKRRMLEAGVPCVPGYVGDDQGDARLAKEAERLGYPLLVKAVAGGGGRGMRLARTAADLKDALAGARREAQAAFGDDRLMLERLVEHARHVEVQVFADQFGNALHLGERDCSTQRRRQKVLEEAPSPIVDAAMRGRMGADAVAAARAVGYVGAGTVEFIVDRELGHCFLEMNTRLQVEHAVTEMITGLDLVEWQLRIADGECLPLDQEQVTWNGHAIEARLYAEDPCAGFAPQTGRVLYWRPERVGRSGVRVDSGVDEGGIIGPHYDAMVAKFIAHGTDRADAARRLAAALDDTPLIGVRNNGRFLRDLLAHADFLGARMHTGLLDSWSTGGTTLLETPAVSEDAWRLAAAVRAAGRGRGWRPASVTSFDLTLACGTERRAFRVHPQGAAVEVSGTDGSATVEVLSWREHEMRYRVDGVTTTRVVVWEDGVLHIADDGGFVTIHEASPWPSAEPEADERIARAPFAGAVAAVGVTVGDRVEAGQALVCVEAMKMELWVTAGTAGTVSAVHAVLRQSVESGAALVEIEREERS
jgi:geranyl-CoA carboxylase alpha subunit